MEKEKILIVEDDRIIAKDISLILKKAGYHITNILDTGEAVVAEVLKEKPDLILLDINLAGLKDGIEVANELLDIAPLPIIFLTSLTDRHTIERAKSVHPAAYMSKPFDERDLEIAVELAIANFEQKAHSSPESTSLLPQFQELQAHMLMQDYIFIKKDNFFEKILIEKINYVEASGHYLVIHLSERQLLASLSIQQFAEKMKHPAFMRVHRSFIVNIKNMIGFSDEEVLFEGNKHVPIGKTFRRDFLDKFR